jgi:hypothetical protein
LGVHALAKKTVEKGLRVDHVILGRLQPSQVQDQARKKVIQPKPGRLLPEIREHALGAGDAASILAAPGCDAG